MSPMLLLGVLLGILPLLAFALFDAFLSLRTACLAAIICAFIELLCVRSFTGHWDHVSLMSVTVIVILSFLSIRLESSVYFKFKPAVISATLGTLLGYMQFVDVPFVYRYTPILLKFAPVDLTELLLDRSFLITMNFFVNWVVVLFFVHAAIVAYAAVRFSRKAWFAWSAFGLWALAFVMFGLQILYLRSIAGS